MNFNSRPYDELADYLSFFIKMGWCTRQDTDLASYEQLAVGFNKVKKNMKKIFSDAINSVPEMKQYLMVHSSFHVNGRDDFENMVLSLLTPTDADIKWFAEEPEVPKMIMNRLKMFDPIPLGIDTEPVKIVYQMWGKRDLGESYEPIEMVDTDWQRIEEQAEFERRAHEEHTIIECVAVEDGDVIPF